MKYIITENRLNQFITEYLNSFVDSKAITKSSPFIIISQPNQGDDEVWDDYMEYDWTDGRLWVNKKFKKNLIDLFGMSEPKTHDFIKNWFENRFNVEVEFVE